MSLPAFKICTTKAHECHHQLEGPEKEAFKWGEANHKVHYVTLKKLHKENKWNEANEAGHKELEKKEEAIKKAAEKKHHQKQVKRILECEAKKPKQDIKEAALLSNWVNLLAAEVDANTADQKIADFNAQVDLTYYEELPLLEEVSENKFEVVLTSNEEEEEDEEEEEE